MIEPLRGRRIFQAIKANGSIFEGEFLKFFHVKSRPPSVAIRVAIVVGKRHGIASARHRIKRRIRASFHHEARLQADRLRSVHATISVIVLYRGSRKKSLPRVTFDDTGNDVDRFIQSIESS